MDLMNEDEQVDELIDDDEDDLGIEVSASSTQDHSCLRLQCRGNLHCRYVQITWKQTVQQLQSFYLFEWIPSIPR